MERSSGTVVGEVLPGRWRLTSCLTKCRYSSRPRNGERQVLQPFQDAGNARARRLRGVRRQGDWFRYKRAVRQKTRVLKCINVAALLQDDRFKAVEQIPVEISPIVSSFAVKVFNVEADAACHQQRLRMRSP